MRYHIIALAIGIFLDLLIPDQHFLPHPIRLVGRYIAFLDKKLNSKDKKAALRNGKLLVILVVGTTVIITAAVTIIPYLIQPIFGCVVEVILTYYILAAGSLRSESMKVYKELVKGDLSKARYAVSMIVGRDTEVLDDIGVTKAAVETVAENTSDGVIAPLLYTAIGGPIFGFFYKSINTMDSMVGYKNDKYLNFGRAAALFDDVVNYIPSRLSAYICMAGCIFCGKSYSITGAYRIHKRDSRKHESPNSAQTESTYAGALGIQLAGDASYFGKIHKKPFIGDTKRPVEYKDIKRANVLMYASTILCALVLITIWCLIAVLSGN